MASGVYDVSVCMCGSCCLFVVVMGKNGGFLLVCGVLMAVVIGVKQGVLCVFYGLLRFLGFCGSYDCVIRCGF